jgi:hypothetical protein
MNTKYEIVFRSDLDLYVLTNEDGEYCGFGDTIRNSLRDYYSVVTNNSFIFVDEVRKTLKYSGFNSLAEFYEHYQALSSDNGTVIGFYEKERDYKAPQLIFTKIFYKLKGASKMHIIIGLTIALVIAGIF